MKKYVAEVEEGCALEELEFENLSSKTERWQKRIINY